MEHPLKSGVYFRYKMPTQDVLDYYNLKLIGEDGLHGFLPAIKISNEIDAFIALGPKEICKHNLQNDITNKVKGRVSFNINDDRYIRLRTKFVCAYVYQILCQIEKCQEDIEEHRSTYFAVNTDIYVPVEYYQEMRSVIDRSHTEFEMYKAMSIDDDFRKGVFEKVTNEVSNYYRIFGLDYTPISEKIEDKAIGCIIRIFFLIIGIFIFWLIANTIARR